MPLLLLSGYFIPFDRPVQDVDPIAAAAEEQYRELPELPTGASERGRAGVEQSAVELAAALRGVPLSEALDPCPADRLQVVWQAPGEEYRHGAVVPPVGPAPDAATEHVNGAVVCEGSTFGYMGFEARWGGAAWELVAVPFVDESDEHVHEEPAPAPLPPSAPAVPTLDRMFSSGIEGYAAYEPQRTCSPTPKPGTVSLQRMLLNGNPGSRNLGISRGCSIGGQSEHKEGRAFDWGVYVTNARERAQADAFVTRLLATDADGNRHALARRMGVMYVIWNKQIWSSYRAADGWRRYSGASPHTDHVHISLSWAGGLGRTSFWSGTVPGEIVAMPSSATVPAAARHAPTTTATVPGAPELVRRGGRSRGTGGDAQRRADREAQRKAWAARLAEAVERRAAEQERTKAREADEGERGDGDGERTRRRGRRRDRDHRTPEAAPATETTTSAPPRAGRDAGRRAEAKRQAEEARRVEAERRAEAKRQVEEARRVEAERRAEAKRQAEEARRVEAEARRVEAKRQAEEARRVEAERRAEAKRRAEGERRDREAKAEPGRGGRGGRGRGRGNPPATTVAPEPSTTVDPETPGE